MLRHYCRDYEVLLCPMFELTFTSHWGQVLMTAACKTNDCIFTRCDTQGGGGIEGYLGVAGPLWASSSCCRGMSAARRARAGATTAEPLRCLGLPGTVPDMSCCRGMSADLLAMPGATMGVNLYSSHCTTQHEDSCGRSSIKSNIYSCCSKQQGASQVSTNSMLQH